MRITDKSLERAYNSARQKIKRNATVVKSTTDAGMTVIDGIQHQVFVSVIRFDADLLRTKPSSGGLHAKP